MVTAMTSPAPPPSLRQGPQAGPSSRAEFEAWFSQVLDAAHQMVHKAIERRNTCVLSTRLLMEIFSRFEVRVRPIPVAAVALNPAAAVAWRTRAPREAWGPKSGAFMRYIAPNGDPNPILTNMPLPSDETWVDSAPTPERLDGKRTGWDAHLILRMVSPYGGFYWIDLTAAQFNNPARDLAFPDIGVIRSTGMPEGHESLILDADNGGLVMYRILPPQSHVARLYRDAPDWVDMGAQVAPGGPQHEAFLRVVEHFASHPGAPGIRANG